MKGLVLIVIIFAFGSMVGSCTASGETEYKVIHDTETVTETETVEVEVIPQACLDAIRHASTMTKAAQRMDISNSDALAIMSEMRISVAMGDSNAVNALETRLRAVIGKTTGATLTIGETQPNFEEASDNCTGENE